MTTERPPNGLELTGQRIAITGRLASMLRREATALIERHGGRVSPSVSQETTTVVVGREGWPLRADGHITRKLQRARVLLQKGQLLEIVPEEQFLRQIELPLLASELCQSYTTGALTRLLGIPRRQIESWQRHGLLTPTGIHHEVPCFDYRQVAAARSLLKLLNAGIAPKRLARSLSQLQAWYAPDRGASLQIAQLLHVGGRVAFRDDSGRLMETNGQMLIEYESDQAPSIISIPKSKCDDGLFDQAVQFERDGRFHEAAHCYRQLLVEEGPDADVCFNLANTLQALGETAAAIAQLRDVLELDPQYVDAWNNLGNLLAEEGRLQESARAYRSAVAIEPDYADAQYGLADVLDQLGRLDEARRHWRLYLLHEQFGPHADYARRRLATG